MKIAFATANLGIHGVATFTLNLSQWLQATGHAVTVLTLTPGEWDSRRADLGIQGECITQQPWESNVSHAKRLAAWLAAQAFDLLVVNVGSSHSRPLQLCLHLLPDALPVVLVLHNDERTVYEVAGLNRTAWNCAVSVSAKIEQTAAARFGQKNVVYIPSGIALPVAGSYCAQPTWTTPLRLLFVGRLDDQQKGIFRLPAILAECHKRRLPVHLTVIGEGPDGEQLRQVFDALGVSDCVTLRGSQPHDAVLTAMRTQHVFLLPSNYEGLPLVLLEAQAHGCVPIAARLPGVTEDAVQDGVSGLLVKADDVAGFVNAIESMLDPARWHSFSTAGRIVVQQQFALPQMGARYLDLFQAMVQGAYPLPLPRSAVPAPFGWRDFLPARLQRHLENWRKRTPLAVGVRWLREQGKRPARLLAYGMGRKVRADWLGVRTYWRYRTLPPRPPMPPDARSKTILVMDQRLLRPTDSTLGRSNDLYNHLLQQMGWRVLLMPYEPGGDGIADGPHGAHWDEPYAVQLRQQGFGVLAGWFWHWRRQHWLQRNAATIDVVLFRALDAAETYLPFFRAHSATKLIFLAPDLNAIRHQREYAATGNLAAFKQAQSFARREEALFQAADAVLTRSSEEKTWLTTRYGRKVFQMPLFFYPTLPVAQPTLPPGQTLLFVGNFAHRPNPDGIHWFVQSCMPLIRQQCPNANLVVAGAFAQADIFALQSAHITVLGRVSDEQLTLLYQQARVVVVPLRFGAGVKGKVIEALAHGVPVVTTRFGVEGVADLPDIIPPTDTPAEIVAATTRLLTDDLAWQRMACAGQHFVRQHFSVQAAQTTMAQLFAALQATNCIDKDDAPA